jgi:hypothetical protein
MRGGNEAAVEAEIEAVCGASKMPADDDNACAGRGEFRVLRRWSPFFEVAIPQGLKRNSFCRPYRPG